MKLRRLSALTGENVQDPRGQRLGSIEDVVIDPRSGRVAYAVLSFQAHPGGQHKFFAIPWQALSYDAEGQTLVIDVSHELLAGAPGFDETSWPDMDDIDWLNEVCAYYGYEPFWEG